MTGPRRAGKKRVSRDTPLVDELLLLPGALVVHEALPLDKVLDPGAPFVVARGSHVAPADNALHQLVPRQHFGGGLQLGEGVGREEGEGIE